MPKQEQVNRQHWRATTAAFMVGKGKDALCIPRELPCPAQSPVAFWGLRDLLGPFCGIARPKVSWCCSYLKNQHWGSVLGGIPAALWGPRAVLGSPSSLRRGISGSGANAGGRALCVAAPHWERTGDKVTTPWPRPGGTTAI